MISNPDFRNFMLVRVPFLAKNLHQKVMNVEKMLKKDQVAMASSFMTISSVMAVVLFQSLAIDLNALFVPISIFVLLANKKILTLCLILC